MFRNFKYLFLFLLIIGGIIYLFNFIEHFEEYEYLSYIEYDMFYDIDSIIDWDAIDWDEVDIDLLDEIGLEEYFGLVDDDVQPVSNESSESSPNGFWLLVCGLSATILGYFKS